MNTYIITYILRIYLFRGAAYAHKHIIICDMMPFARHTLDAFQFCQVSVGFYANLTKDFFVINIWLKLFVVTMVRKIVKTDDLHFRS